MTKLNAFKSGGNISRDVWNFAYIFHALDIAPEQEDFDSIFYALREYYEMRCR